MGNKNGINLSIIDKELKIDGSIISKGKLIIKGSLKGALEGETVIIAEEGTVASDATVVSMTIGGHFEGQVVASKELIILSTGSCSGKVECNDLSVENGGVLNAEVSCKTSKRAAAQKEGNKISELVPGDLKKVENIK